MATKIKLETKFADNSTRELLIGTLDDNIINATTLKTKIFAINDNAAELQNLYFSKNGATFSEISNAQIIIEQISEIDLS